MAGPDGNLSFIESVSSFSPFDIACDIQRQKGFALERITPAGIVTDFPLSGLSAPIGGSVALGADGNFWFPEFTGGNDCAHYAYRRGYRIRN